MDQKEDLRVVYDQVGTPTYAEDLARAIMQIISDVESGKRPFVPGIFNYSNEGVCSWYDLAMEVCRLITCGGKVSAGGNFRISPAGQTPALFGAEQIQDQRGLWSGGPLLEGKPGEVH